MRNKAEVAAPQMWARFAKESREGAGLSKASLAEVLGINRNTPRRWEGAETLPQDADLVVRFAVATGADIATALKAAGMSAIAAQGVPEPAGDDLAIRLIRSSPLRSDQKRQMMDHLRMRRIQHEQARLEEVKAMISLTASS